MPKTLPKRCSTSGNLGPSLAKYQVSGTTFFSLQELCKGTTAKSNEQSLTLEFGYKSGCGEVCLSESQMSDVLLH